MNLEIVDPLEKRLLSENEKFISPVCDPEKLQEIIDDLRGDLEVFNADMSFDNFKILWQKWSSDYLEELRTYQKLYYYQYFHQWFFSDFYPYLPTPFHSIIEVSKSSVQFRDPLQSREFLRTESSDKLKQLEHKLSLNDLLQYYEISKIRDTLTMINEEDRIDYINRIDGSLSFFDTFPKLKRKFIKYLFGVAKQIPHSPNTSTSLKSNTKRKPPPLTKLGLFLFLVLKEKDFDEYDKVEKENFGKFTYSLIHSDKEQVKTLFPSLDRSIKASLILLFDKYDWTQQEYFSSPIEKITKDLIHYMKRSTRFGLNGMVSDDSFYKYVQELNETLVSQYSIALNRSKLLDKFRKLKSPQVYLKVIDLL